MIDYNKDEKIINTEAKMRGPTFIPPTDVKAKYDVSYSEFSVDMNLAFDVSECLYEFITCVDGLLVKTIDNFLCGDDHKFVIAVSARKNSYYLKPESELRIIPSDLQILHDLAVKALFHAEVNEYYCDITAVSSDKGVITVSFIFKNNNGPNSGFPAYRRYINRYIK